MKFRTSVCGFIFIFLTGIFTCSGQGTSFQHKTFTTENGLSHNVIFSITQDMTGFIWLATWDGISRFDGNEFRNYHHDPDDPGSLPFFMPSKVIADSLNNLWILTTGRPVYKYCRANDNFIPAFKSPYTEANASDINKGPDGTIWVYMDNGILKYNPDEDEYTLFKVIRNTGITSGERAEYASIAIDNTGQLWLLYSNDSETTVYKGIISGNDIICKYAGSFSMVKYQSYSLRNSMLNPGIIVSGNGSLWLSCKYGLYRYNAISGQFIHVNNFNQDGYPDQKSFCWSDELTGLNILNTADGSLANLPVPGGDFVECFFIDREGAIWSGNINKSRADLGLTRYTRIPDFFSHYLTGNHGDRRTNIVFPVVKDRNGDLWIGTRYDNCLHLISQDGKDTPFCLPPAEDDGRVQVTKCMTCDRDGIWFGTNDGNIYYYRFETRQTALVYPSRGSGYGRITGIHNIVCDGNSLVINGSDGIFRYTIPTGEMKLHYRHEPPGTGFTLVKDGQHGFWLGTWGSRVIHLDSTLAKTREFAMGDGGNIVEHICPGDNNDIWVALMGEGLGHLYPATGEIEIYTTTDGLSNNITYSIIRDDQGLLWIATNQGISMFNPVTRLFRNFGQAEGLLVEEFDSDSYFKATSGELLFGGVGGVVAFHPDSIASSQMSHDYRSLTVTGITVSGLSRLSDKAPYESDTIHLRKGENNFQATITLFEYNNPEKIRYRYRLLEEDDNWIMANSRTRTISYANLTHRDYHLELEATDELGEWIYRKSLLVIVPHRFTEQPLVRMFSILLFIVPLVLASIFYFKQQNLKEKNIRDRLRLESLRSQMNPHFVFNSLSSINYFIAKEDKLSANEYIADFSRLIRSVIDNAGEEYIPLEKEIQALEDYLKLEHLRFGDRFSYSVTSEVDSPGDVKVFPGMIQPFLENAIWHGVRNLPDRLGHINIRITRSGPEWLRCIVEDDGVGRRKASLFKSPFTEHRPRGIDLALERLQIYNSMANTDYRIFIEDLFPEREETGTRVFIDLPAVSPDFNINSKKAVWKIIYSR